MYMWETRDFSQSVGAGLGATKKGKMAANGL
jgi:hypothetical protein